MPGNDQAKYRTEALCVDDSKLAKTYKSQNFYLGFLSLRSFIDRMTREFFLMSAESRFEPKKSLLLWKLLRGQANTQIFKINLRSEKTTFSWFGTFSVLKLAFATHLWVLKL